jgi:hypothetical protein
MVSNSFVHTLVLASFYSAQSDDFGWDITGHNESGRRELAPQVPRLRPDGVYASILCRLISTFVNRCFSK